MQLKHPIPKVRICGWLVQLPLLLGAAICFFNFTGLSGVVSAYYGLPSRAQLVASASHAANLWPCAWITFSAVAIALTTALLPVSKENLTPVLRGVMRTLLAILIVAVGNFGIGEVLARKASHLH